MEWLLGINLLCMDIQFISHVDRIQWCIQAMFAHKTKKKNFKSEKKISDQFYPFECKGGKVKSASSHDNTHASNTLQKNV